MVGLQMFSTYSVSYMATAVQAGQAQSTQKPPPKEGGASETESKKGPPPPKGGEMKSSSGPSAREMSGRFMMMGAETTQSGGRPKPSNMVASQLGEAGVDMSGFDAKAFDEAVGTALSELSSKPDQDTMEDILLSALSEQGIETEGVALELPEKSEGGKPPPPQGAQSGAERSSENAQQQAILALFQTSQQLTITQSTTTSFYA